jgi:hypothetical protein
MPGPVDQINETLFNLGVVNHFIDNNSSHVLPSSILPAGTLPIP